MLKTIDGEILDVEVLYWDQARLILNKMDPELVKIIDELSPSKDYRFYKAKYPFGTKILDKNLSYLPLKNGKTISFNSDKLSKTMIKDLSYDPAKSNPVAMVLDKQSEIYLSINQRNMPYQTVVPGDLIGLSRIIDNCEPSLVDSFSHLSFFRWELTSGARSLFMLPKITENIHHAKLKKMYGLSQDKPDTYQDHWSIFSEIAAKTQDSWCSEFLFFATKWFKNLKDPAWAKLYCYFLKKNNLSYNYWRNLLSWQITFNVIEQNKNLRYSAYTLDTIKHLFAIADGNFLGFRPAIDENSAPIKTFQKAYLEGYVLKEHCPIIIEPSRFSLDNSVYYSLNYPTLVQCDPETFKGKSLINLLDELQHVTKKYQMGIRDDVLAKHTSLHQVSQAIDFSYYHNTPENYTDIKNNIVIPEEDQRFICETGAFPNHSPFLKGCIKISAKGKNTK
jgi:hypothetical protein